MAPKDPKQDPIIPQYREVREEDQRDDMQFEIELHRYFGGVRERGVPPRELFQRLERIPQEKRTLPTRVAWSWWGGLGLGLSAALFLLFVWTGPTSKKIQEYDLVPKGKNIKIHLEYARMIGASRSRYKASDNQVLYPGDLFQFVYKAIRNPNDPPLHLMIVSLQQSGKIFVIVPFQGKISTPLEESQGTFPKGESLELGKGQGKEVFFAFLSKHPFQASQLKTALTKEYTRVGQQLEQIQQVKGPWTLSWSLLIHKQQSPVQER